MFSRLILCFLFLIIGLRYTDACFYNNDLEKDNLYPCFDMTVFKSSCSMVNKLYTSSMIVTNTKNNVTITTECLCPCDYNYNKWFDQRNFTVEVTNTTQIYITGADNYVDNIVQVVAYSFLGFVIAIACIIMTIVICVWCFCFCTYLKEIKRVEKV